MIDHISIGVSSLEKAAPFYSAVLGALGYAMLVERPGTIGFGKKYPCLWLNHRPELAGSADRGWHVALRAREPARIDMFHAAALAHGGSCDGAPGWRQYSTSLVYAAFITDVDGNRLEALCIAEQQAAQE